MSPFLVLGDGQSPFWGVMFYPKPHRGFLAKAVEIEKIEDRGRLEESVVLRSMSVCLRFIVLGDGQSPFVRGCHVLP